MYPITKTKSGLIYKDDFTSLSSWNNDGTWSNPASPAFISWGILQQAPLTHGSTFDKDGTREPNPFIDDDGTYYMLYDGGDGVTGWTSFIARSYDKGATWEKLGVMPPGFSNGTGGSIRVNAMGYLTKFNGKYCYYRVTGMTLFNEALPGNPNVGLPAPPYTGDMWESANILSGWVYKGALVKVSGTWTESEHLPCSVFKSGSTYYLCSEGAATGGYYQIGLSSGSTPFGPWTQINPSIYAPTTYAHGAENSKIFYHPQIDKWIMLSNLIANTNTVTDQNAIHISSSPTDWSAANMRFLHRICPMDGAHAIGVVAPVNIPDGTLILANGDVPIYYDSNPERYEYSSGGASGSGGWHLGRKLEGSMMELSTNSLKFESGASGISRSISINVSHSDFVSEFGVQFSNNTTGTNITFTYRSNGGNGYKLTIRNSQWLLLQKITGGVPSTLFAATSGITTSMSYISRLKIVVQGSSHKAYIDGELQVNVTDSTYTSGSTVSFGGLNASNAEIRLFHMRLSDSVTVDNINEFKKATLKMAHGAPSRTDAASNQMTCVLTTSHYPLDIVSVNGIDFSASGRVWGGDEYFLDPTISASFNDNTDPLNGVSRVSLNGVDSATSGTTLRKPLKADVDINFTGKTVIYVGDSITFGVASTNNANRWTSLFSAAKGATEDNRGLNGRILQNGSTCSGLHPIFDPSIIPQKSSSYAALFIALGTNDIGLNDGVRTPEIFKTVLSATVDNAVAKGWKTSEIVLVCPYYMGSTGWNAYVGTCGVISPANLVRHQSYVSAVQEVAYLKGCKEANIYQAMLSYSGRDGLLAVDGVHPNDAGHLFISNFMSSLTYKTGL